MPQALVPNRTLISGTESTGPVPPGTGRVEQLIEWIGLAQGWLLLLTPRRP